MLIKIFTIFQGYGFRNIAFYNLYIILNWILVISAYYLYISSIKAKHMNKNYSF